MDIITELQYHNLPHEQREEFDAIEAYLLPYTPDLHFYTNEGLPQGATPVTVYIHNRKANPTTMSEKSKEAILEECIDYYVNPDTLEKEWIKPIQALKAMELYATQERAAAVKEALEGQWVKCSEILPENEDDILICRNDGFEDWLSIGNYSEGKFFNVWDWQNECYPTHWNPIPNLPQPPKTESE